MDKFPLMQGGVSVGELITEQEALYTWFEARCRLPGEGLWCAWAVGDRGELRLGVLEPCGDRATIRRRFSARLTAPLGKLRQGEIRPAHPPEPEDWTPLERSAVRLRSPWLREQLHLVPGVLVREHECPKLPRASVCPGAHLRNIFQAVTLHRFTCFLLSIFTKRRKAFSLDNVPYPSL